MNHIINFTKVESEWLSAPKHILFKNPPATTNGEASFFPRIPNCSTCKGKKHSLLLIVLYSKKSRRK